MKQKVKPLQYRTIIFWGILALQFVSIATPANALNNDNIRAVIINEAQKTSVPSSLALAVVRMESNFRADHEGKDGARGLMQVLPDTALGLGMDPAKLWQVRPNLRAGLKILSRLLKRTDGRWEDALLAYGSARRDPQSVKNKRYVTAVLKIERQFAEQLAATNTLLDRRSDVLAGHDNWNEEPEQQVVQTDTRDDEWQQQGESVEQPKISIVRGRQNDRIEIIIYESEQPQLQRRVWRPPHPQQFRPRLPRQLSRIARQQRRFAHQFDRYKRYWR